MIEIVKKLSRLPLVNTNDEVMKQSVGILMYQRYGLKVSGLVIYIVFQVTLGALLWPWTRTTKFSRRMVLNSVYDD